MSEPRSDIAPGDTIADTHPDAGYQAWLDDEAAKAAAAAQPAAETHADPAYQAWLDDNAAKSTALDAEAEGEPACPKCNATDANPSHEILPHCWKCGYTAPADAASPWPPDDMPARRQATALRRVGL